MLCDIRYSNVAIHQIPIKILRVINKLRHNILTCLTYNVSDTPLVTRSHRFQLHVKKKFVILHLSTRRIRVLQTIRQYTIIVHFALGWVSVLAISELLRYKTLIHSYTNDTPLHNYCTLFRDKGLGLSLSGKRTAVYSFASTYDTSVHNNCTLNRDERLRL